MTPQDAKKIYDEALQFKYEFCGKGKNGPRVRTLLGSRLYRKVMEKLDSRSNQKVQVTAKQHVRNERDILADLRSQLTEKLAEQRKRWTT